MRSRTYTKDQLLEAIKTSFSTSQVLKKLNLAVSGGNYTSFNLFIKEHNIDISHFTGKGWAIDGKNSYLKNYNTKPLDKILSNEVSYISSHTLKKRLIREGYFDHKCSICENTTWLNLPIPIELDHINGDHFDNRLENLRILCPNCHSQTDNYCSKNKKQKKVILTNKCVDCDKKIRKDSTRCTFCAKIETKKTYIPKTKIDWPPIDELLIMVQNSSYSALGKQLGVSDNAIRKRIKKYS